MFSLKINNFVDYVLLWLLGFVVAALAGVGFAVLLVSGFRH